MAILGAQEASGASFFDGIYDVFCTRLNFLHKQLKHQEIKTQNLESSWRFIFSAAPSQPIPKPVFDCNCHVSPTFPTLRKRTVFGPPREGWRPTTCPYVAKAKATPHAMPVNMLRQRCLVASPDLKQIRACGSRTGEEM